MYKFTSSFNDSKGSFVYNFAMKLMIIKHQGCNSPFLNFKVNKPL